MLWSWLLLPLHLLSAGVLAKSDTFEEYHPQARSGAPILLDDATYKDVTGAPRDYTVIVLLTAMDSRYACQMCRDFDAEWRLLSKAWAKGDKAGDSRMLFSVLDFNDGRDTFMGLGLQTAPVLLLFQPTVGEFAVPNAGPIRYDFAAGTPTAESVRDWVARYMPGRPVPEVHRPTNWLAVVLAATTAAGIATAAATLWPYVGPVVQSRKLWQFGSLMCIMFCISGGSFNLIRGVPYAGHDGKGHIAYLADGFQTQYQLETQIIAALYCALAFCVIALADKVPRLGGVKIQQTMALVYTIAMLVLYSLLLSIFRFKNGGYPFALPPFL